MNSNRLVGLAALGILLAGPMAVAQEISVDWDHSFNFAKVKTYSWAKVQASDPLVEPRITLAIDRDLQEKGWHLVDHDGNVSIAAVDAVKDQTEYTTFYNGLGGLGWKRGWGTGGFMDATTTVQDIPIGMFVVDMYNKLDNKLIWRATAIETVKKSEDKNEQTLDKSVDKMLAKFPPKPGSKIAPNQTPAPDSPSSDRISGTN